MRKARDERFLIPAQAEDQIVISVHIMLASPARRRAEVDLHCQRHRRELARNLKGVFRFGRTVRFVHDCPVYGTFTPQV